jgi:hypothetical protein
MRSSRNWKRSRLPPEEAEKAARKAIREQKKKERKETRQQRVDALKAKFRKQ